MHVRVAPDVRVKVNARWVHGTLQKHFGLNVTSSLVLDVTRESIHVLESSLNAGHSVSLGEAVSEALQYRRESNFVMAGWRQNLDPRAPPAFS